jgi:hypothetical protein
MVKDRFSPNDRIPLFLSGPVEEPKQSGIRKAASSDIFRKVVFVFAGAAVVFAAVAAANLILFASVTASEVNTPPPRDGGGHSMPAIQSTANADALPRTAPGDELLAGFKSALDSKTEVDQPRAEPLFNQFQAWAAEEGAPLFNQFQAWAAEEDAQAQARPPQSVQGAQAQSVQKPSVPPLPKPRPIHAEQTARVQGLSLQNAYWPVRSFSRHN